MSEPGVPRCSSNGHNSNGRRGWSAALHLTLALALALGMLPRATGASVATNLLQNGSMETFYQYATDPGTGTPLTVATAWHIFVQAGAPYFMSSVQFATSPWGTGHIEGYEGNDLQMIFTPNGAEAFVAGLYQTVTGVTPGVAYAFSGRFATVGTDPTGRMLGIDPTGGTDPASPNVIWGAQEWASQTSAWQNIYMAAIAQAPYITVFIKVDHPVVAGANNSETFLDAFVLDVAPRMHTNVLPPFQGELGVSVSWAVDWQPPETTFDWYEVQVRDGSGGWSYWLTKTSATSAILGAADCHTYYFQSRVVVKHPVISNVGSRLPSYWPGGDGQTHVTILSAPPSSTVSALPGFQPGVFTVEWEGAPGSCGITGYDVQVRDGTGGAWADWLRGTTVTRGVFAGQDGHTTFFRSRARGIAGYAEAYPAVAEAVTTIDASPPVVSVGPLPDVEVTKTFAVSWTASDGGSGVAGYDVQTRSVRLADDWDSGWANWLVGTSLAGASFTGEDGQSYMFGVTARDAVGNAATAQAVTSVLLTPAPVLATSRLVVDAAHAQPSDVLTYVLTLPNTGNLGASVVITEALPLGDGVLLAETVRASAGTPEIMGSLLTWQGSVNPGDSASITACLRLSDTVAYGTRVTGIASVYDGVHDPFTRTASTLVAHLVFLPVVASYSLGVH